ncbi:hypothetical protein MMC25_000362 [Agyrium rufum]|nr:hypothetical protein [Agyrium rufum]
MNGFADHGLDDAAFGEKPGSFGALRTFDAFRQQPGPLIQSTPNPLNPTNSLDLVLIHRTAKTKPTYTRRTTQGGYTTLLLLAFSFLLSVSELRRWLAGHETQQFSVEKGVSHTMQINLDTVVAMKCADLHINVQDASGDRILAGEMLKRAPTNWQLWVDRETGVHKLGSTENTYEERKRLEEEELDTHVGHVIGEIRSSRRKFKPSPKLPKGYFEDACRIYGSLEGNKVQGDFHITARGHGYQEYGAHLDHEAFNFSHLVSELSFGPLYPSLQNPLDHTVATTPEHFNKFLYYLSVVPTIFTRDPKSLAKASIANPSIPLPQKSTRNTIMTNQYAVTTYEQTVAPHNVPGIFFKYDIEPILLTIAEERVGFLSLLMRIVNVVSGVLVGGGWLYQLWDWGKDNMSSRSLRRRSSGGRGVLHGNAHVEHEDEED